MSESVGHTASSENVHSHSGYEVLHLHGQYVSSAEVEDLRRRLSQLPEAVKLVILDMSQVSFVNSLFLSSLLAMHTSLNRRGIGLAVQEPNPTVMNVLHVTRLDQIIPTGTHETILRDLQP